MNPNVRRTYCIGEPDETRETKVTLQPVDPFPFLSEDNSVDTDEDDYSTSDRDNNVDMDNGNVTEITERISRRRQYFSPIQFKYSESPLDNA